MGAQLRMAYQRTRQRSLGQVISELQEAEANLRRAARGSFAEEYAENRVRILKREKAAMEKVTA
jgi:hypothetical protein